jgi:hypothetical protein
MAARASFVVGSAIGPSIDRSEYLADPDSFDGLDLYTHGVQQSIAWSATDDTGVRDYDLYGFTGEGPSPIFQFSQQAQYQGEIDNYDGSFGGGSAIETKWLVTARDDEWNMTTRSVRLSLLVTQEDQTTPGGPDESGRGGVAGAFSYVGPWAVTNCACFSGAHTRRTSAAGATATFTGTFKAGEHVALVMAEGPARGRAAILVDGVQVGVVDTFASVNTNRIVVFERVMTGGTHTVTVRNLATPGRSRIDLDAVMTN